jgi:N,N'-diacetyllegionaminate synthase
MPVRIGGRDIGRGHPCFIIAEVAQSHDGSLGMAHAFIDAAAEAGADAIKFQTHMASQESTRDEPFRVAFSRQDASRYDYWKRMEFTPEQWRGLRDHARDSNVVFMSSAFSVAAVDVLEKLDIPAWKVGSGEFRSHDLLDAMIATGKPILMSTGMSSWSEIDLLTTKFSEKKAPFALFQCTSRYPSPLEKVGLNVIEQMRNRYRCPVGLSDHTGAPYASFAAVARGADMLEVHVTFHKKIFGPDVPASITFEELREVTNLRAACRTMDSNPVDKDKVADEMQTMRGLFSKSLAPVATIPAGTILRAEMLIAKKPGTGIPPAELSRVIGRTLAREVTPDRLLNWSDIAGGSDA